MIFEVKLQGAGIESTSLYIKADNQKQVEDWTVENNVFNDCIIRQYQGTPPEINQDLTIQKEPEKETGIYTPEYMKKNKFIKASEITIGPRTFKNCWVTMLVDSMYTTVIITKDGEIKEKYAFMGQPVTVEYDVKEL